MSILIKGMEMPTECRACPLCQYYPTVGETRCRRTGEVLASGFRAIEFDGRSELCQLVELPEKHGGLVDVGVLKKAILKWMPDDPCGSQEKEFLFSADFTADICTSVMMEIEEAPIVVEAEGE